MAHIESYGSGEIIWGRASYLIAESRCTSSSTNCCRLEVYVEGWKGWLSVMLT